VKGQGVTEAMWDAMVAYAKDQGLSGGNFKKLNLPFENRLLGQPADIRERMVKRVEDFVYNMLVNVLNCEDTAPVVLSDILETGSFNPGAKVERIDNPADWTPEKIREKSGQIGSDKGPDGDFDD
jgi:hypothetical protein